MKTLRKNISLSTALQEYADKMSAITTGKNAIGYIKNCSHKIRHSEPFSEQNETDDMKSNECLWIITRKKKSRWFAPTQLHFENFNNYGCLYNPVEYQ